MRRFPKCFVHALLTTVICLTSTVTAQKSKQSAEDDTVKVDTSEVLVDIVARDKKGKTVRDLRPEEIEVYEDGVKQQVSSFRLFGAEGNAEPSADNAAQPVNGLNINATKDHIAASPINLVTMVFDSLGLEAGAMSQRGAKDFLKSQLLPNTFVAVFKIDQNLRIIQQFTNDRKLIEQAIDKATRGTSADFEDLSDKIRKQLEYSRKLSMTKTPQEVQSGVGSGPATPLFMSGEGDVPSPGGNIYVERKLAEITINALRITEERQREQQGRSSLYSLLTLVREERALVGRKTLLFFAEGVQVPPNLRELFQSVISEANRANVSIYSVDPRGLNSTRAMRASRDMLIEAMNNSMITTTSGPGTAVKREEVMAIDTAEASINRDDQGSLGALSDGTGGFLMANTNDLRSSMQRVAADLGMYYGVTYTPQSREYDGKFHQITIKVSRPGIKLQTRKGYYALPPTEGKPVLPYEIPMLAALNKSNEAAVTTADYRVATFRFAQNEDAVEHQLVVEVPLKNFTFTPDADKKTFHTKFAMMTLVKDSKQQIVKRFSQYFPLTFPAASADGAKSRNVVFLRNFDLAPGRYTLETVAYDFETERSSVQRRELTVPLVKPGVGVSDLILIKRVEPIADLAATTAAEGQMRDPLRYYANKIVPMLDAPAFVAGRKNGLPLYFMIYPATVKADSPAPAATLPHAELTLEFRRNGELIGHNTAELPAPNKDGVIPYVITIPTDSFRSGEYEVKAIIKQGQLAAEEKTSFTINPSPDAPERESETTAGAKRIGANQVVAASYDAGPTPAAIAAALESEQAAYLNNISRELPAPNSAEAMELLRLIGETEDRGGAMHQKVTAYTYSLKKTRRELNEKGKVKKEDIDEFEAYPIRGQHKLVQTRKNGEPVPSQLVSIERRGVGEELEKIEKEEQRRSEAGLVKRLPSPWDGYIKAGVEATSTHSVKITIDVSEFLHSCQFYKMRREKLGEREAIVLDFVPRAGVRLPENKAYLTKLNGKLWIDALDKVVVRLEAWPAPVFEKAAGSKGLPARTGPAVVYQQTKLPSGVWLPSLIRMNAEGNPYLFAGVNWDVLFEMSDYKLFDTSVENAEVGASEHK